MTAVPQEMLEDVRSRLALEGAEPTPARVAAMLRSDGRLLGDSAVLAVVDALQRDTVGAGALEPLLREPGVTDVVVNGADAVYVDRGDGLERAPVRFPDDASVRRLAQRLASAGGRRLDDSTPYVDVRLVDGTRFHAVLAPIAQPGTCLSLRVPARRTFDLQQIAASGSLPPRGVELLRAMVEAQVAFVVSGGTPPCGKPHMRASRRGESLDFDLRLHPSARYPRDCPQNGPPPGQRSVHADEMTNEGSDIASSVARSARPLSGKSGRW
ncbi:MAG TPA: ATPase, T2SS/T4P/T4SS family [Nocardioidaceae bacterium]|nr:ATPase, T2SS/T4P/T4SS family [Nocardioidaceae bacterium]